MLKLFNLDRDGCQHFSQILDEDIINDLSVAVDSFLGVEKIFNKIYHDPFYIGDHYAMILVANLKVQSVVIQKNHLLLLMVLNVIS